MPLTPPSSSPRPKTRGCWPRRAPSRAELASEVLTLKKMVRDLRAVLDDRLSTRHLRPSEHENELRADVAALKDSVAALAVAPPPSLPAPAPASPPPATSPASPPAPGPNARSSRAVI